MTKIQEILEIGLEKYLEKNKTIGYKQKVIKAIKNCKSDKLGAHKYVCDECGSEEIAYNSCRNRPVSYTHLHLYYTIILHKSQKIKTAAFDKKLKNSKILIDFYIKIW